MKNPVGRPKKIIRNKKVALYVLIDADLSQKLQDHTESKTEAVTKALKEYLK